MAENNNLPVKDRLRIIRERKKDSQADAAKKTGMNHQMAWWRLEQGYRIPPQHAASVSAYTDGEISEYELLHIPLKSRPRHFSRSDSEIPVFDAKEVAKLSDDKVKISDLNPIDKISLPSAAEHHAMAFALPVLDELMVPVLKIGDFVVVDPSQFDRIKDNALVAAISPNDEVFLGHYTLSRSGFSLISENGKILGDSANGLILLGPVVTIVKNL